MSNEKFFGIIIICIMIILVMALVIIPNVNNARWENNYTCRFCGSKNTKITTMWAVNGMLTQNINEAKRICILCFNCNKGSDAMIGGHIKK